MNDLMMFFLYSLLILQFAGVILFAITYKKLTFEFKLIGIFILGSFIIQILNYYLSRYSGYNLFLVPAYGLFEFLLFSVLFGRLINIKNKIIFRIIISTISILLIAEGANSYLHQNAASFNSYGKIISNLSIISYTAYYIISALLDKTKKIAAYRINLSFIVLTYYVLTLLNFIAINFLVNNQLNIVMYFWQFHALINTLFFGVLTFLLWKHGNSQKSLH